MWCARSARSSFVQVLNLIFCKMTMRRSGTLVVIEDTQVVDGPAGVTWVEVDAVTVTQNATVAQDVTVTQDVYQQESGIQKLPGLSHVESTSLVNEPDAESLSGLFDAFTSDNRQRSERIDDAVFAVATEVQTDVAKSLKRLHDGDFKSLAYPILKPTVQGCMLCAVSHLYEGLGSDSAVCKDDSIEHALSEVHIIA